MKSISSIPLFALLFSLSTMAQTPGDTIVVQSWDYNSTNRDTTVDFSSVNGLSIERVIMRYAMRCKGALVSTTSNRNLGCGEWDYSCNTYIHDPNAADSIESTTNKFNITPNTNLDSVYSLIQTYKYIPSLQKTVMINSITNEDTSSVGPSINNDSTIINSRVKNGRTLVYYTASELTAAGLLAGDIDGLNLSSVSNSTIPIKHFKIDVKSVSVNPFTRIDTLALLAYQNTYYHDVDFQTGDNRFQFHTPFNWDGTSDLLIQFTYEGDASNPPLFIATYGQGKHVYTTDDYSLNLFPNNYVEANTYQGITTFNDRTVEAWIKTSADGEITSWGTNNTAEKQAFRINSQGQLRLEINGAYAVATTPVNDGQWHHVAYTFSGFTMHDVKFYIDGNLDQVSSISSLTMFTQPSLLFQISKGFHNRYFTGEIDNIRVWSAELSGNTLKDWMHRTVYASSHPNVADLELSYLIQEESSTIKDFGPNQYDATFYAPTSFKKLTRQELFKEFRTGFQGPAVDFYQGTYNQTVLNDTVFDTIPHLPYLVEEKTIFDRSGTTNSDSIGITTSNYYPKNNELYDLNGNIITGILSSSVRTLGQRTLNYYQRNPQKLEIMSFVTPYGINLDLGAEGKAWYFDVSDFLPTLRGNRRMTMERGGQWQEEMDIQFLFIIGTPPAEVKSIRQIWKADQRNYTSINNNTYFKPRTLDLDTSARRFKLRSAITGHGQQGEFILRLHTLYANGTQFSRSVWKECDKNPVYPQGGTWIYDRAGWCPGMATDVAEYDISHLITGNTVNLDYDMNTASGDSRYIVSNQLVEYGATNFTDDARIERVLRPTDDTEFGRRNPTCFAPIVILKNTGSNVLTSANIEIILNGSTPVLHTWTGNLQYMDETNVLIPVPQSFWASGNQARNHFTARITGVNNGTDQYTLNNEYTTQFTMTDTLPTQFRAILRTNSAANENSYVIKNSSGQIVFQKNGLVNNQTYDDLISLPPDCYQLLFYDTGDDGLSFFANSAGNGYFRLLTTNYLLIKNFNPDFGDGLEYYFRIDQTTGIDEQGIREMNVYPNPANEYLNVELGLDAYQWSIVDGLGKVVKSGQVNQAYQLQQIDIRDLANGIYFFKASTKDRVIMRKVIKQ